MERAGAAICTNSVAEIKCGVPPRGRDLQKSPDGMSERRQWVGHMRGVPSDTAAAFKRAREAGDSVVLCVSGGTVSQSTKSTETTKSKLRKGSRGYDQSL